MAVPLEITAKTLIKKEDAYRDKIKGRRSLLKEKVASPGRHGRECAVIFYIDRRILYKGIRARYKGTCPISDQFRIDNGPR